MHQTTLQILKELCSSIVNMITIMSTGRSPHLLFMLIVSFSLLSPKAVSGFNSGMEDNHIIKCIEREQHALLMIKQSLVDDYGSLSSWGPEDDKKDCCQWQGVSCSNRTGHVVKLDLGSSFNDFHLRFLRGNLSSSMLELQQLNYLNLSFNDFGGQPVPIFIGCLKKLRHLDLSYSGFGGQVPYQLGNLSRLQSLDLSTYYDSGNPNLCGPPLPNKCLEIEVPAIITHDNSDDDMIITLEFYVCLAIGFIIGFWGVLGSLFLNRSWRHAYCQFLNHAKDRLHIAMVLNIAKLRR